MQSVFILQYQRMQSVFILHYQRMLSVCNEYWSKKGAHSPLPSRGGAGGGVCIFPFLNIISTQRYRDTEIFSSYLKSLYLRVSVLEKIIKLGIQRPPTTIRPPARSNKGGRPYHCGRAPLLGNSVLFSLFLSAFSPFLPCLSLLSHAPVSADRGF